MKNSDRFWNIIDNANSFSVRAKSDTIEIGWAKQVNLAFAVELYIKAIMEYENQKIERGHDLKKLFEALNSQTQDIIYGNWRTLAGDKIPDNEQIKEWFQDNMYACSKVFERFRYVHEWADSRVDFEASWDRSQWEQLSILSGHRMFGKLQVYDNFLDEFEKAVKKHIDDNIIPNNPMEHDMTFATEMITTITRPDGSTKTERHKVVMPMQFPAPNRTIRIDLERYKNEATKMIKSEFNIDLIVEFVEKSALDKRLAELEKLYGKVDGLSGFFSPEKNGNPPIMIVGYDKDDVLGFIEVFYYELQNTIDYYEALKGLGQEYLRDNMVYFSYYTVFNASKRGIYEQHIALLKRMTPSEQHKYLLESKEHAKEVFKKYGTYNIMDVLNYLARAVVFRILDKRQDNSLLAIIPQASKFISMVNCIHRYQPTQKWYSEFKTITDGLTIQENSGG